MIRWTTQTNHRESIKNNKIPTVYSKNTQKPNELKTEFHIRCHNRTLLHRKKLVHFNGRLQNYKMNRVQTLIRMKHAIYFTNIKGKYLRGKFRMSRMITMNFLQNCRVKFINLFERFFRIVFQQNRDCYPLNWNWNIWS